MEGLGEKSPFLGTSSRDDELHDFTKSAVFVRGGSGLKKNRYAVISIIVAIVVAILVVVVTLMGIFLAPGSSSNSTGHGNKTTEICANPPLLLVSLDGFQADYLSRNSTPQLHSLITSGLRASYMRSTFPTKTFPNHYSIVTGLYPESHGIVGNSFYDTKLKDYFHISGTAAKDSKWWKGEPVWVTAAKHKLVTGVYYWPGSEAEINGFRPTYYFPYNRDTPFSERVDTVLSWFDMEKAKRPQFLAMYFNQPDKAGHSSGPNSAKVNSALVEVDAAIQRLWEGLEEREIADCVNIMIVSDHGMSSFNKSSHIYINKFLSPDLASKNITYPSLGTVMNIGVDGGELVEKVYESIVANGTEMGYSFRAFHTSNLPLRLHAGHSSKERYGPIFLIADDHAYMSPNSTLNYVPPAGNHGYDNIEKSMQTIFIAHGPAFKSEYVSEAFDNIQLYSLMCDLLKITAAPNNGSVGALHRLLDPQLVKKLPPAQAPGGSPGVNSTCPFPSDEGVFKSRSICEDCVCRDAAFCPELNDTDILARNRDFNLTHAQEVQFQAQHFPWGVPPGGRGDGACILTQPTYSNLYSTSLRIPLLVGYTLNTLNVSSEVCLRRDPRVSPTNSANCSTFNSSARDEDTEDEYVPAPLVYPTNFFSASLLTAVVPRHSSNLSGAYWLTWSAIRAWASVDTLNVMAGSVLDANRDGFRDGDSTYPDIVEGVAIPSHFFVVVTRCGAKEKLEKCRVKDLEVLGMLFQHPLEKGDYLMDDDRVLRYSLTPLRDIERVTGLDFFPNLSAEDQNLLELRLVDTLWPHTLSPEDFSDMVF